MLAKDFLNQLHLLHQQMPFPALVLGDRIDTGKILTTLHGQDRQVLSRDTRIGIHRV